VLPEAQLRALLASAKSASFVDRRDAAVIRLLLDTGGRLSEVAGLAVADLDFTEDVAHVIGKGRRPRALPFGQQTGLALGRYLRARAKEQQATGRSSGWRRRTAGCCPRPESGSPPTGSGGPPARIVRLGSRRGRPCGGSAHRACRRGGRPAG
jgi:integrase